MPSEFKMTPPIFAALDMDNNLEALNLAKNIRPYVGGFKIGPRLSVKYGANFIKELKEYGLVFLDNKYYDIPNTMLSSVKQAFEMGVDFVTIHGTCGPVALKALAELEAKFNEQRAFRILVVTILTSFNDDNLPANYKDTSIEDQVLEIAKQSYECGLKSFVCSPLEVSKMREAFPDAYLVTPGIRMGDVEGDDQQRVLTPPEAIKSGASALVIGRPIYKAQHPQAAAEEIFKSLSE